jgi:hypothetical protein
MKHDNSVPTLIFRKINTLSRKTNQLNSLVRAQLIIALPNQKRLRTTVNLEIKPTGAIAPTKLYASNERGRPKKIISHATLIAEYQYLLHSGKKKLDARLTLVPKYGYSNERAVRRITNAAEWDDSRWCITVQPRAANRPAIVVLLDRSKNGKVWGSNGHVLALSGTGWLWIEGQKFAAWKSMLEIHTQDYQHLFPDLLTNEKYLLERFPAQS